MNTNLADDLAYVRDIAEQGADAPSLSGRYLILWGGLGTLTTLLQWGVLKGMISFIAMNQLGFLWIGYAIIGMIGTVLITLSMRDRPGSSAANNKVSGLSWQIAGGGIFIYFVAVMLTVILRDMPVILFDTILPAAFLAYGTAYAAIAAVTRDGLKWLPVVGSIAASFISMLLVGLPELYLAAAAGLFTLTVIPGIIQLRQEPSAIV